MSSCRRRSQVSAPSWPLWLASSSRATSQSTFCHKWNERPLRRAGGASVSRLSVHGASERAGKRSFNATGRAGYVLPHFPVPHGEFFLLMAKNSLLLLVVVVVQCVAVRSQLVDTPLGRIRGRDGRFLGVPFARAPVGASGPRCSYVLLLACGHGMACCMRIAVYRAIGR